MKRKFWFAALVAALILLLGAAALASGSTCTHSWTINGDGTHTCESCYMTEPCSGGKATCQSAATCALCGGKYGNRDLSAHQGGTATCTSRPICNLCKSEYGSTDPNAMNTRGNRTATARTCGSASGAATI